MRSCPITSTFWSIIFLINGALCAQVAAIGSQAFELTVNNTAYKVPYYSSHSIESNETISTAVVVIHGIQRNADVYYDNMLLSANLSKINTDSMLIVAPQFLTENDVNSFDLDNKYLYWSRGGWIAGSNSKSSGQNPRQEKISSYAILDSIIYNIAKTHLNLKSIIVTGHSAGGQVVQRYAATNTIDDMLCKKHKVAMKYVVANPSSYLYLDEKRFVSGSIDQFDVPSTSCVSYNEWKYGLEDLYSYPLRVGGDQIRENYRTRNVTYLLGEKDNDIDDPNLDRRCPALLQGRHRLERGLTYYAYLKNYYGELITEYHKVQTVPESGHSNYDMYTSAEGRRHLFATPPAIRCDMSTVSAKDLVNRTDALLIGPNPTHGNITVRYTDGSNVSSKIQLELYSIDGKPLLRSDYSAIDLQELDSGIYFLKINLGRYYRFERIVLTK